MPYKFFLLRLKSIKTHIECIFLSASNDATVVRHRDFNSASSLSDDESPSVKRIRRSKSIDEPASDELLMKALAGLDEKRKREERQSKITLDLAERRDRREQVEHDHRIAEARRREERERREARGREWKEAMELLDHPNPLMQARGQRLAEKLTAEDLEEGI